jgi:hypothetical protein
MSSWEVRLRGFFYFRALKSGFMWQQTHEIGFFIAQKAKAKRKGGYNNGNYPDRNDEEGRTYGGIFVWRGPGSAGHRIVLGFKDSSCITSNKTGGKT